MNANDKPVFLSSQSLLSKILLSLLSRVTIYSNRSHYHHLLHHPLTLTPPLLQIYSTPRPIQMLNLFLLHFTLYLPPPPSTKGGRDEK